MTHLSDNDLEWIEVYKLGDNIFFRSNIGTTDTMGISNILINNQTNRIAIHDNGGGIVDYKAYALCSFYLSYIKNLSGDLCVTRVANDLDSLQIQISIGGCVIDKFIHLKQLIVNNRTYSDCIIADSTNTIFYDFRIDKQEPRVNGYAWSKSHGLLYYSLNNGEVFFNELIFNTPNDSCVIISPGITSTKSPVDTIWLRQ